MPGLAIAVRSINSVDIVIDVAQAWQCSRDARADDDDGGCRRRRPGHLHGVSMQMVDADNTTPTHPDQRATKCGDIGALLTFLAQADEVDNPPDDLRPARGICHCVLICLLGWAIAGWVLAS